VQEITLKEFLKLESLESLHSTLLTENLKFNSMTQIRKIMS
jgi:hypothetical protein